MNYISTRGNAPAKSFTDILNTICFLNINPTLMFIIVYFVISYFLIDYVFINVPD